MSGPSPIGERIHMARELAEDLSARELSSLAEQAPSLVAHIERGEIQTPRPDTLMRIAAVLGVSLDWLIGGEGAGPVASRIKAAVASARRRKAA